MQSMTVVTRSGEFHTHAPAGAAPLLVPLPHHCLGASSRAAFTTSSPSAAPSAAWAGQGDGETDRADRRAISRSNQSINQRPHRSIDRFDPPTAASYPCAGRGGAARPRPRARLPPPRPVPALVPTSAGCCSAWCPVAVAACVVCVGWWWCQRMMIDSSDREQEGA